jgi:hypothetical protein
MASLRVVALLFAAGCSHSASGGEEDASGPPVLTIGSHPLGVVTSTPAGIQCGTCSGSAQVCPMQPPPVYSDCSFQFPAGTSVKLALAQQDIYFATSCAYADGGAQIPDCTFTINGPAVVDVTGVQALR